MNTTISIHLSETTLAQVKRAAELARQSVDTIIEHSLTHSLPPLLEEIPAEYQPEVYPLLFMSEADLTLEARRRFSPLRWKEYESLLEKRKASPLTPDEQAKLDSLRREADVLTFRKGYAAALLKRRGARPPSLAELSRAE